MAYDVKFLTGTKTQYDALASKDAGTLYFLTDTHEIYRGTELYATGTAAADFKAAIEALDATVGSLTVDTASGKHVAVQVVEENGKLTGLTVTENDIASKTALDGVTTRVGSAETNIGNLQTAVNTINGEGEGSIKKAVKDEADRAKAAEKKNADAIAVLNGTETEAGSVAYAVKAEADRAKEAEKKNADAIAAEKTRAEAAESALDGRLDIIEGDGEGSIKKAAADAVAKVVASAPADFDTLKEVADWIANDTTGAAKMQADIAVLKGADTVEGSVAKALKDAKTYADGLDSAMDTRVDALEAAIGEGGSVASQITAEINKLDATVETAAIAENADGIYVKVVETDGKLTGVEATIEVSHEVNAAKEAAISAAEAYTDAALTWGTIA